jgi:hypothetical protein
MQTKTKIQHGAKRGSIVVWSEHRTITYQVEGAETTTTWHIGTVTSVTRQGEARSAVRFDGGGSVELITRLGARASRIGNDVLVANKDQVDIAAVEADTSLHHAWSSITEIREALAQYKV